MEGFEDSAGLFLKAANKKESLCCFLGEGNLSQFLVLQTCFPTLFSVTTWPLADY